MEVLGFRCVASFRNQSVSNATIEIRGQISHFLIPRNI